MSFLIILITFIIFYILGHAGPAYLVGTTCVTFLGCNAGPLGYDALLHVISSILYVLGLLWLIKKYPKLTILTDNLWKNVFIIISFVALMSVAWEIIEYTHDSIRLAQNPSFPTLELDQPTNADTMGDLIISLIAGAATLPFVKKQLENKN